MAGSATTFPEKSGRFLPRAPGLRRSRAPGRDGKPARRPGPRASAVRCPSPACAEMWRISSGAC